MRCRLAALAGAGLSDSAPMEIDDEGDAPGAGAAAADEDAPEVGRGRLDPVIYSPPQGETGPVTTVPVASATWRRGLLTYSVYSPELRRNSAMSRWAG